METFPFTCLRKRLTWEACNIDIDLRSLRIIPNRDVWEDVSRIEVSFQRSQYLFIIF